MIKNLKKYFPVLVSLLLMISLFPISVCADESFTVSVKDTVGLPGDTLNTDIIISNNPGIAYLKLKIEYDCNYLALSGVNNTGLISGSFTKSKNMDDCPFVLLWINPENSTSDGVVASLSFSVSDSCPNGKYPVKVTVSECYSENGSIISAGTDTGYVTVGSYTAPVISMSDVSGSAGDTVTADISISDNPGIAYLKVKIDYDSSVLSVFSAEKTDLFGGTFIKSPSGTTSPYVLLWVDANNMSGNGTLASIMFKISEDAISGSESISISEIECYDSAYNSIFVDTKDGSIGISGNDTPVSLIADSVTGSAGNSVSVNISLNNNTGIAYMKIKLSYDKSVLTLTGVENTGSFNGTFASSPSLEYDPYVMVFVSPENSFVNGDILKLTFDVSESAKDSGTISLSVAECYDEQYNNVPIKTVNGNVNILSNYILGDLNGDGKVNVKDSFIMRSIIIGSITQINPNIIVDFNNDGKINVKDSIMLISIITGYKIG